MEKHLKYFVEYVSEAAGQQVVLGPSMPARLPQYLNQLYVPFEITVAQRRFLGVMLKDSSQFRPATFEKHLHKILGSANGFESYCLIAEELPSYVRARLIQRKIPFVVPGQQLYWPELGLAVQARKRKNSLVPVEAVSPATQALLLYALTGGMTTPGTPKTLAKELGYTTMTISRALDEIEANDLGKVDRKGRERLIEFPSDPQALWKAALPYLRNPVREIVRIEHKQPASELRIIAGETALAEYSVLAAPREPVYALGREAWKRISGHLRLIPVEDENTCIIQLWRYDPGLLAREGLVDCFSLFLSLRDEEDERVQRALEEMMEKRAWS